MQSNPLKTYKCIPFLSMAYILILFASAIIGNKLITTPITMLGAFSAGSITGPLWFVLSNIVAEVYDKRLSIHLFVAAMIAELIFICICIVMIHLPSPSWWNHQDAYNYVIDHLLKLYFYQLLAITIAWHVNLKLLTRWHFILKGRYFFLRSIGASAIGEIIFSIISVSLNAYGFVPINQLPKTVIWSCVFKMIFLILFSYPACLIVAILKKIEKIEPMNYDSNPFKTDKNKNMEFETNAS